MAEREQRSGGPAAARTPHVIVCGTDFSAQADRACEGAALLARHFGARVAMVNVVDRAEEVGRARERLAAQVREHLGGIPVTTAVIVGDAPSEIARLARRERADLVVIGAHRGPDPLVPVGIEAGLARVAPCPVLALASPADARALIERLARRVELRCAVCGRAAGERICFTCRARISWQAMEHKWHHELREGPGLMGLGAERAAGPLAMAAEMPSSAQPASPTPPPPEGERTGDLESRGRWARNWLLRWRGRGGRIDRSR